MDSPPFLAHPSLHPFPSHFASVFIFFVRPISLPPLLFYFASSRFTSRPSRILYIYIYFLSHSLSTPESQSPDAHIYRPCTLTIYTVVVSVYIGMYYVQGYETSLMQSIRRSTNTPPTLLKGSFSLLMILLTPRVR